MRAVCSELEATSSCEYFLKISEECGICLRAAWQMQSDYLLRSCQ